LWQNIVRKAKLAESKERKAIIEQRMEAIEIRVAAKLAGKGDPGKEEPKKGWFFGI